MAKTKQRKVTKRQIEAFQLTVMAGFNQYETAAIMNISQQRVSKLLKRLEQQYPELFDNGQQHAPKFVSYQPAMDSKIVHKF